MKKLVILAVAVLLLLAWAPWMDNGALLEKVSREKAHLDGTIDRTTGEVICDYDARWVPFGRMISSCEGGYFVTFWGKIL